MKTRNVLLAGGLALAVLPSLSAQTTLVDWGHTWNYMHPTAGALPAGSGATEPNSGATKWYASEANFAASYAGPSFTTAGTGFDAGAGPGPLGYGAMDYFTAAGAEFTALATTLTTPTTKYTGYFRTTFTVPTDTTFYVNPKLRYIMDDGGFVYLDGVLILRVNMASTATDTYTALAANTTGTEANIREADLSLPVGSLTGGNTAAALANNATIIQRVTSLTPGVHTLAISVHNRATGSSDLGLAAQLSATSTDCSIVGSVTASTRNLNGTPADPSDDTIGFALNVVPTGTVSSTWTIAAGPLAGTTGAYNTNVPLSVPIADFSTGSLALSIADSTNAACTTAVTVLPQRIIASDDHLGANSPIVTGGSLPATGWVFDDAARTAVMNNGGGGARKVVSSEVIDLSAIGALQFSGQLVVDDTSSGCEAADSFTAYLIIDGNTANRINLIDPAQDTGGTGTAGDGILSGGELTPATVGPPPVTGAGSFTHNLRSYVVLPSANSVQVVFEGINDSGNEKFTVQNLKFTQAPPSIQLGIPTNVERHENGPGAADDTLTFNLEVVGINGGTTWSTSTAGVSPTSGSFGTIAFTVAAPLATGLFSITISDPAFPAATQTASVTIPGRFIIGQKDFGLGFQDVLSSAAVAPATVWAIDEGARTLTNNTGVNAVQAVVESETIDLSSVGAVHFSATLDANDTSTGSNYDLPDKFKLELVIDGGAPISLVGPYDVGDGTSAVPYVGGVEVSNGPADGWINGYSGTASAADGFADAPAEYNAHKSRDEFNLNLQDSEASMAAVLNFSYDIPEGANSVKLVLTSQGINGTETAILKNVLFATSGTAVDTDSDGMSDAYENAYGLDPNSAADKFLDKDGDGQNNYAEFLAGTVPNNAGSVLKATGATKVGGNASVTWTSVPGKVYLMEISPDLSNGSWLATGEEFTATGTSTSASINLSGIGNPKTYFLRIKVKP